MHIIRVQLLFNLDWIVFGVFMCVYVVDCPFPSCCHFPLSSNYWSVCVFFSSWKIESTSNSIWSVGRNNSHLSIDRKFKSKGQTEYNMQLNSIVLFLEMGLLRVCVCVFSLSFRSSDDFPFILALDCINSKMYRHRTNPQ